MILYAWNLVPFFDAGKNELIKKIYQLHYIWNWKLNLKLKILVLFWKGTIKKFEILNR